MSLPDLSEMETEEEMVEEKKPSIIILALLILGLSGAAVGIGYVIGEMLRPKPVEMSTLQKADKAKDEAKSKEQKKPDKEGKEGKEEKEGKEGEGSGKLITLDPIIVTLPSNNNSWLRLELAALIGEDKPAPDDEMKAQILADISALLRNLKFEQVFSPSGYMHLQEDLLDRARLTSDGAIADIFILSLVAE